MKDIIKITIGTTLTVILTVFTLGVINGSGTKQYSTRDIPGVGWVLRVTEQAGRTLGENMQKSSIPPTTRSA